MTMRAMQRAVYQNKLDHHFNVTDINLEFNLLYGEVAEAFDAWNKKRDSVGEELADVAIYLMGLSETLGVDLQDEGAVVGFYGNDLRLLCRRFPREKAQDKECGQ